jgi:hypothetical protein
MLYQSVSLWSAEWDLLDSYTIDNSKMVTLSIHDVMLLQNMSENVKKTKNIVPQHSMTETRTGVPYKKKNKFRTSALCHFDRRWKTDDGARVGAKKKKTCAGANWRTAGLLDDYAANCMITDRRTGLMAAP